MQRLWWTLATPLARWPPQRAWPQRSWRSSSGEASWEPAAAAAPRRRRRDGQQSAAHRRRSLAERRRRPPFVRRPLSTRAKCFYSHGRRPAAPFGKRESANNYSSRRQAGAAERAHAPTLPRRCPRLGQALSRNRSVKLTRHRQTAAGWGIPRGLQPRPPTKTAGGDLNATRLEWRGGDLQPLPARAASTSASPLLLGAFQAYCPGVAQRSTPGTHNQAGRRAGSAP